MFFSQVDLTFVILPDDSLLWSRINANMDLASHHSVDNIASNVLLMESMLDEMCKQSQAYETGIRVMSSKFNTIQYQLYMYSNSYYCAEK
jgi:hypothetical protein